LKLGNSFAGERLCNITFFDRENPDETSCEDIPVEASFCVFVRDTKKPFVTTDSENDRRLTSYPKRGIVNVTAAFRLLDRSGQMFGSICHFDLEPGEIAERDVETLEYMATVLRPEFESQCRPELFCLPKSFLSFPSLPPVQLIFP